MNPSDFVVQSPKVHLHCHLEGCLRATTFLELTEHYGLSTRYSPGGPVDGPRELDRVYAFENFREFLMLFGAVSRSLRTVDDYGRLAREFAEDAAAQHVVYGELFISPSVWGFFNPDLDVDAAIRAVTRELGDRFRLILDLTRNFGPESGLRTVERAARLADAGVIGVGLGGDEANFPATLFADAFERARREGLRVVVHAGEAAGAESVGHALDVGAERIGHGIRALEDADVIARLRRENVPIEVCPASNYRTAVVRADAIHPIADLHAARVPIVVDADDPTLFGTSITADYAYVEEQLGRGALRDFILNAVRYSFLAEPQKQALYERVYAELSALQ